jgi:hypothetical protein
MNGWRLLQSSTEDAAHQIICVYGPRITMAEAQSLISVPRRGSSSSQGALAQAGALWARFDEGRPRPSNAALSAPLPLQVQRRPTAILPNRFRIRAWRNSSPPWPVREAIATRRGKPPHDSRARGNSGLSVLTDPANPVELFIVRQLREFLSNGDEPLVPLVVFCAIERRAGFGAGQEDLISRPWRDRPPLLARKLFARLVGNDRAKVGAGVSDPLSIRGVVEGENVSRAQQDLA